MNSNGWDLDEMNQEVLIAPFLPDECQKRLELLDQAQVQGIWSLSPRFIRRYLSRTKVIKIGTVQTHVLYNVQRVNRYKYGFVRDVYAEMNVVLIPAGNMTQVELYLPTRMTTAQKWWLGWGILSLMLAPVIVLPAQSAGGLAAELGLYLLVIGAFFYFDWNHFVRAREILYGQVVGALTAKGMTP